MTSRDETPKKAWYELTPEDCDKRADERGAHRPYCGTELGGSCNCGLAKRQRVASGHSGHTPEST